MNGTGSGRPQRLAGGVITTEAAAAIPDGVLAVEMTADQDPQRGMPGIRRAPGRGRTGSERALPGRLASILLPGHPELGQALRASPRAMSSAATHCGPIDTSSAS